MLHRKNFNSLIKITPILLLIGLILIPIIPLGLLNYWLWHDFDSHYKHPCSKEYNFYGYINKIDNTNPNLVTAFFVIFQGNTVINNNYGLEVRFDKFPHNLQYNYVNHTQVPLYANCEDRSTFSFEQKYYLKQKYHNNAFGIGVLYVGINFLILGSYLFLGVYIYNRYISWFDFIFNKIKPVENKPTEILDIEEISVSDTLSQTPIANVPKQYLDDVEMVLIEQK